MTDLTPPSMYSGYAVGLMNLGKPKTEMKKATVAEATEAKKALLAGPDYNRSKAVATVEGNYAGQSDLNHDLAYGYIGDNSYKYGADIAQLATIRQQEVLDYNHEKNPDRGLADTALDLGLGVGAGAVATAGGILALGAGLVSDKAGSFVADATNSVSEGIRSYQSEKLQTSKNYNAIRKGLDAEDNQIDYEKDLADGKSFAELRRFGREVVDASSNLWDNPAMAGDLVAEGVGSFVVGSGIAKVASMGAAKLLLKQRGVTGQAAERFLGTKAGQQLVSNLTVKGMPISIGLQEAGSAYAGIQAEIQGMSESELMAGSPEYTQLRQENYSHEEARNRVANLAGLEGGAIQGLVGAATGKLVSKFEANPLSLGTKQGFKESLVAIGENIVRETMEEGTQGLSGGFATNLAIQDFADKDRSLTEDLGGQLVESAVAGAGMASVTQTPRATLAGASVAAATTYEAAMAATGAVGRVIDGRVAGIGQTRDAASPVGQNATTQAAEAAQASMTGLQEKLAATTSAEAKPGPQADFQTRMSRALDLGQDEIDGMPESVRKMFVGEGERLAEGQAAPRVLATDAVMKAVTSGVDAQTRKDAILWLHEQAGYFEAIKDADVSSMPAELQDEIRQIQSQLDTIQGNAIFKRAVELAPTLEQTDLGTLPEITDENVETSEIATAVGRVVQLAHANPIALDPSYGRVILNHVATGKLRMEDVVRQRLEAALQIAEIYQQNETEKQALTGALQAEEKGPSIGAVSQMILSDGKKNDLGQYGLKGHIGRIMSAARAGNTNQAQVFMENLKNFAEHMQNKVEAANRSLKISDPKKNKVPYRTWTSSNWIEPGEDGAGTVYVLASSQNNIATGKAIVTDAKTVADIYDILSRGLGSAIASGMVKRVEPDARIGGITAVATKPTLIGSAAERYANEDQTPEPEEVANPKERRLRKDAVVKSEESLLEQEPNTMATKRPAKSKEKPNKIQETVPNVDQPGDVSREDVPVSQEATEETEATSEEEAGEAVVETEVAVAEGNTSPEEASGTDGKEVVGTEPVADAGSELVGRLNNPFTHLVKSAKGLVRFVRAYSIDTIKSPLVTSGSPIEAVLDSLKNFEANRGDLFIDYELDEEQKEALASLVQNEVMDMVDAMNAKLLSAPLNTKDKPILKTVEGESLSPLEALAYGEKDFTGFRESRSLNLVDETTGEYEATLIQLAAVAAMNWAMNSNPAKIPDAEDVAKMFGVNESQVTREMMQASRNAVSGSLAVESLAREIMEFWGAKINGDAPMSDSLGIAQGLASDLLSVMRGKITVESTIEIERDGKKLDAVAIKTSHPATEERIKKVSFARSYLKDAFVQQEEKAFYFDEPPAQVRSKQKRNLIGKLGAKIQRAMRKHQEQKFYRNTPMLNLMQSLGQDAWMEMMGFEKVLPDLMNREHRLSVEGRNTQLQKSWEGVQLHNLRQEAHARATGKTADEVVTHFDVYAVSNERIHQDGFNPQSNKTMRETWVSTESTLDLDNTEHRHLFWLTVGQSSGLVKTEIVYDENEDLAYKHAKTAAKTEAMVETKYGKAIKALMGYARSGEFTAEDQTTFRTVVGKGVNEKLIHSLLAVAQYRVAMEKPETRKEFRHFLSLEADGKTDGPMAALVNHSMGKFTVAEIRNFRRGGFFLGRKGRTLNEQFQNNTTDTDLYDQAAKGAKAFLKEKISHMKDNGGAGHVEAMMRFLSHFSEDFSYNAATGEMTIKRGLLKNPLTVTVYGSGANGIADKISGALLEAFYERMTELEMLRAEKGDNSLGFDALPGMEDYGNVLKDLHTLASSRILYSRKKGEYFTLDTTEKGVKAPLKLARPRDFSLTPANREMFSHNLRQILVNPMRQGIGQVMANPQAVNAVLQRATQVQSQTMMAHFRQAVKETLADKRASGELEKGEFLSQNDYNEIYRKMSRFGAVIEPSDSNENHLNLSGSESVQSSYEFTRSLEGKYGGGTRLPEPTDAGVSASAMMTISRGDAMMMVNYFASQDPDLRVLAVFDGLEMPADGINTISEKINKAVAEAWLNDNGPKDLADSFADFIRQGKEGPFAEIKDVTALQEIAKAMGLEGVAPKALVTELTKSVTSISEELNQISTEIQARKAVMRSIEYSMDHMASGRTPYDNDGEVFDADPTDPNYDDKLVGWLNLRYEEELAKLKVETEYQLAQPSVAEPTAAFTKKIKELGVEMGYRPITRMTTRAMVKLLGSDVVSKDAKDVLAVIQKGLPNFTFLFGSSEELTAYRDETYPEMVGLPPIDLGQTDMHNQVVYIVNGASETVLHEAFHTATMGVALQGYTDPGKLDDVQKAALENLERMMAQFMDMDFRATLRQDLEQEDGSVLNVAQVLQRQVADALARGDELGRAIALNEFMAWTLSNQNLIDVMRKTKVRTPLRELVFKATAWIRKLLKLPAIQKLDMFSNILLNTGAMVQGDTRINSTSVSQVPAGVVMNQTTGSPVDSRLQGLLEKFELKVASHLRDLSPLTNPGEEIKIKDMANHALSHFRFHGFDMDQQQASAFRSIQVALASSMQLDKRALVQAQRIFSHVTKQLSPKDFENYPDGNLRSQSRFNVLMGEYGFETDIGGRSNLLASFLALAQVDPAFRKILDGIALPKDRQVSYASTDEFLTSLTNSTLDTLGTAISGGSMQSRTSREALDRLSLVLGEIEKDERLWIEKQTQGFLDTIDQKGSKFLSSVGERLSQWADDEAVASLGKARNAVKDTIRQGAAIVGSLMNENRGKAMASAAVSLGNQSKKVPAFIVELMNEVVGMTDENRGVLKLVNKVKAAVSGMRQDYREEVPKILAEKFSRELTNEEWSSLHLVLGKTDSGVLRDNYAGAELRKLLTDKAHLAKEIQQREDELKANSKAWATYQRKAKELARFMVTGEVRNNDLTRNAGAIVAGIEKTHIDKADAGTIELIDLLTTLYALVEVGQDQMDVVAKLADTEADGIDFLAGYLWSVAKDEKAKIKTEAAKVNHYKGYIPSERKEGISLLVRDDSEHNTLIAQGYTRMGEYKGAGVETGKKSYYFSTVSGNGTYTQGALQTIQQSASGVDPRTGRTVNGTTAGVIHGKYLGIIQQRLRNAQRGPVEALLPIRDAKGQVVAYERHMAPHALSALERNTHMGEMLGAWAGRQAEEELAQEYNLTLVKNLKTIWDRDKAKRADEFVDISKSADRIYADSWDMVPNDLRAVIGEVFEDEGFQIRKDMINNAVGYRAPSITDPWTGISRMSQEHQDAFVKIATALHGDAFTYLATAEKAIQAGVSVVKSTIVVRSIVIPLANLASNFLQLSLHGVSIRDMVSGYQTKLLEITKYQKNLKRVIDIKAEMTAQRSNKDAVRRLETELRSIEDSNRRMSIWQLVEAGEFATISEGLTEADAALSRGKWAEYIQGLMDKIPAKAGTIGRYAFITRDTALFQGMSRVMQYGDFLGKAVLHDHLIKQGKTKEQALQGVTEEFVNYNLLPGRTRSYADSMGLTWFWAFKLRSIKIALQHIQNHPFRALMMSVGNPMIPDVPGMTLGSPIEDNMLSVVADGRLGYSIGPGMAFNAPSLHPWVNLAN